MFALLNHIYKIVSFAILESFELDTLRILQNLNEVFIIYFIKLPPIWYRELGIGLVAYSPLGRGFFGGKAVVESLPSGSRLVCNYELIISNSMY
jgi:aryl-alcohol dehydrogenase-like predicted oxidoreductase